MKDNLKDLEVEIISKWHNWRDIADGARTTIGLEAGQKEITDSYARKMYGCEHSPIRMKYYRIKVRNIPYWIVMHFTRHKIGIEHFVSTQRDDRTDVDRESMPQDTLVTWEFCVNAAAIIFISRRRLCNCAHVKTRRVWQAILDMIKIDDSALYSMCVPECVYRGHCFEYKSCNYHHSQGFEYALWNYRKGINTCGDV